MKASLQIPKRLQAEIQEGIENYAYTTNSKGEKIYAFEVDGLGNASIMDDPNVPSLLAAPYLGYCAIDDEVYQATRRTILSPENPYFYEGKYASGLEVLIPLSLYLADCPFYSRIDNDR